MNQHLRNTGFTARKATQGMTLVELLLVIVAGIVLIGLGLFTYSKIKDETGATNATQGVVALSSAIKTIYPTPSYTGLDANVLIRAGKAPSNMVSGTGATATLVNNWGGTVTVAPSNYGTGTNNAASITVPMVPRSACNSIVPNVAANFQRIEVNGTAVKDDAAGTPLANAGDIATECDTEDNTLVLTAT